MRPANRLPFGARMALPGCRFPDLSFNSAAERGRLHRVLGSDIRVQSAMVCPMRFSPRWMLTLTSEGDCPDTFEASSTVAP